MRNQALHDALRGFADEACALLRTSLAEGAELAFEVVEEGDLRAGAPVLYRYRPLTAAFIGDHWPAMAELDSHRRAADALGAGAAGYLRHRGLPVTCADDALRDVLERALDDVTSFELPEDRFDRIAAEVDAVAAEEAVRATVIAPLHGIRLATGRVRVGDGLFLARRSAVEPPPAALEGAARAAGFDDDAAPEPSPLDVFCILERDLEVDEALPVDEARTAFRRVLTGLRLCGAGGTALGPLAWARAGAGAWHPVALGVSARARAESWELRYGEEDELADVLGILARSRHGDALAWSLGRFEMGCERQRETEALSDYLLGLRALLADDHARGDQVMARRVAALCAPTEDGPAVRACVEEAARFERQAMFGGGADGVLVLDSPRAVVREVEQRLRSLLRDALCGYLDEDLRAVADELSGEVGRPGDDPDAPDDPDAIGDPYAIEDSGVIRAADLRRPREEDDTRELVPVSPV